MACIGSSTRLCVRVHEKLCQFGKSAPVKKKFATSVIKTELPTRILSSQIAAQSTTNQHVVSTAVENNNISNSINSNSNEECSNFTSRNSRSIVSLPLKHRPEHSETPESSPEHHTNNRTDCLILLDTTNTTTTSNNCCKNHNEYKTLSVGAGASSSTPLPSNYTDCYNNYNYNYSYVTNYSSSFLWRHPWRHHQQRTIHTTNNQIWTRCTPSTTTQTTSTVSTTLSRHMSSVRSTQQPNILTKYQINPYRLIEDDLREIFEDIRLLIRKNTNNEELHAIGTYYFDGQGKAFRPMVCTLLARALNHHMNKEIRFLPSQKDVAMISEMIHIASLIHDDVIDQAEFRRGKPSANVLWNHKKVAMAGDFILAVASMMIARLRNDNVTLVLSEVITDLVQGEFMQLGSKETENERFAHYLTKTYRKTASLIANSLKSIAILSEADEQMCELAYQYGRNLGLGFQLVDDLLDFVSSAEEMGKPAATDLKLGLATAPVLFACEKYPELTPMIMRRFAEPGDCERAFELVHKSQGLKQTQFLAQQHCMEAARLANTFTPSPHQKALIVLTDFVLNRMK